MKSVQALTNALVLLISVAGCGTESSRIEQTLTAQSAANSSGRDAQISVLAGAPVWVNEGSNFNAVNGKRLFYGVGSAAVMGDMALQKATADDYARAEAGRLFASFITNITHDFMLVATAENILLDKPALLIEIEKMRSNIVAHTRISGSWRDIKSGSVWSAATLDLDTARSQMAASAALDERFKTYFEASADIAFERMAQNIISPLK